MKVIVPVAGVGNRLKPHTNTLPKPLLAVAGRPMLDYVLEPLHRLNPDEVIFVIGYRGDQIKRYVTEHYDFKATFVEQNQLLGLGYAIYLALEKTEASDLLIVLGDTIAECDLVKFTTAGSNVLGLRPVNDPNRFGIAELKDGMVVGVEEKPEHPKTDLALIGLYYISDSAALKNHLDSAVVSDKRTSGEIQLTDALSSMINEGLPFTAFEVDNWLDCGKKETMLSTNSYLLKNKAQAYKIEGSQIVPPVFIAESVSVTNSVIGPNVSVSDNCKLSGVTISNSIIYENCVIADTVIKDSLVGPDARVKGRSGE